MHGYVADLLLTCDLEVACSVNLFVNKNREPAILFQLAFTFALFFY